MLKNKKIHYLHKLYKTILMRKSWWAGNFQYGRKRPIQGLWRLYSWQKTAHTEGKGNWLAKTYTIPFVQLATTYMTIPFSIISH